HGGRRAGRGEPAGGHRRGVGQRGRDRRRQDSGQDPVGFGRQHRPGPARGLCRHLPGAARAAQALDRRGRARRADPQRGDLGPGLGGLRRVAAVDRMARRRLAAAGRRDRGVHGCRLPPGNGGPATHPCPPARAGGDAGPAGCGTPPAARTVDLPDRRRHRPGVRPGWTAGRAGLVGAPVSRMLLVYWFRRCGRVLVIVALVLAAVQWLRDGAVDWVEVLFWSALPAVLSASINTWWARTRGC